MKSLMVQLRNKNNHLVFFIWMQVTKFKWLWEDFHKRREICKNLGMENFFEEEFQIQLFTVNHLDIFSYQ